MNTLRHKEGVCGRLWNVRGINNRCKGREVLKISEEVELDVHGLTETKVTGSVNTTGTTIGQKNQLCERMRGVIKGLQLLTN